MFSYLDVIVISIALSLLTAGFCVKHFFEVGFKAGASYGVTRVLRTLKAIQDIGGDINLQDCNCPECVADRAKGKP